MLSRLSELPINKVSSLFFRMSAMASKFVIFTFLSKHFDESTYGVYALLATTITIAIFILGFDFYNYLIRDILISKTEVASKIYTSLILYGATYLLFIILGYFLFGHIDYFSEYSFILIAICITEHLNQEIYRLMLAFKKVFAANLFLFFRVAGWTLFVLMQILVFKQNLTLYEVLVTWGLFNGVALLLVPITYFGKLKSKVFPVKIKKKWLLTGLKVSIVFYAATLALKTIEYSNRYIVELVLDEVLVGVFSFYSNFSMVIGIYVSTIVVSYELPDLIESSVTPGFNEKLIRFKKLLLVHSSIASVIVVIAIYPVLVWQGKDIFISYWPLLILLTAGMFFMNISLIYHSYLYIKHREKKILEIIVISGIVNVISTYILSYLYGLYGAGAAFLLTGILMFTLRKISVNKKEIII